jgi:hypothetical protein
MDGWAEVTRAYPPAAPVLKGAGQGVEDGETGLGNTLGHSTEDGTRWVSWATASGGSDRMSSVGDAPVRERRRGSW